MITRIMVLLAIVMPLTMVCSQQIDQTKVTSGTIAFIRDGDVYTVKTDGSRLRRLTTDGRNAFPLWSPDGRYIAFSKAGTVRVKTDHEQPVASLWITTSDGKYKRAIRNAKALEAYYPAAWLPDKSGLLVTLHLLDSDAPTELQVVTLNGRIYPRIRRWTRALYADTRRRDVNWFTTGDSGTFSPDGKSMMFSRTVPLNDEMRYYADIDRMTIEGTGLRRLDRLPDASINNLRWSPSAMEILSAEIRYRPGTGRSEAGLWLRDTNGRIIRKLIDLNTASFSGVDWSPVGSGLCSKYRRKAIRGLPTVSSILNTLRRCPSTAHSGSSTGTGLTGADS